MSKPKLKPELRYLNEFIGMHCAPDILLQRLFPDIKEITESMAAYSAVRTYLWQWFRPSDPDITLVAVGDGATPRTAALFAYRTAWQCHSVDPRLSKNFSDINRLILHKDMIEDINIEAKQAIIVAVHSHANLQNAINSITANHIGVVAIPCCVSQKIDKMENEVYEDHGILSPQRIVHIYRWRN